MANHFYDSLVVRGPDDALFLRTLENDELSYAAMRGRVARLAGALKTLGVKPGDRVAAQIEKSAEGLMLYLGAITAGAAFLPLNAAYTPSEIEYFLRDAEPKVTVCDPAWASAVADVAPGTVETLSADGRGSLSLSADAEPDIFEPVERGPDDLAAILYTSGTTGRSKGAMLTHENLVSNAKALAETWRFTAHDRLLHALPIYHTHGLFVAVNTTLVAGASLVLFPKFDTASLVREMRSATAMMGVPTFYTRLLDHEGFTREVAQNMRVFISGSAPLLADTHRAFFERSGHTLLERYGMTETNMNCSNPYDGERRPGTVGFPLPGISVRVVDPESGAEVERGDIGMIEVKGPNVFKGYWRNEEKTRAEFRPDGFFKTGDLGRIDADGYVQISGRDKDLIISGGFNVYPKEIEVELDGLPGVVESAVVGLPHKDFGEGVTAIVVRERDSTLDEKSVVEAISGTLAKYKQPKRVLFVDDLPRNTMGKVQKNVLRETYKDTYGA